MKSPSSNSLEPSLHQKIKKGLESPDRKGVLKKVITTIKITNRFIGSSQIKKNKEFDISKIFFNTFKMKVDFRIDEGFKVDPFQVKCLLLSILIILKNQKLKNKKDNKIVRGIGSRSELERSTRKKSWKRLPISRKKTTKKKLK